MKTAQQKVQLVHHGLRLNTPAPRVQKARKHPSRAQMRAEVQHLPKGLPAAAYAEEWL